MDTNTDFQANLVSAFFAEPDMEFQSKEERESGVAPKQITTNVNGEDVPRWVIYCNYLDTSATFIAPEVIKVKVPSKVDPNLPPAGTAINFGGLYQNVQERRSGDGKGYTCSFSAQTFALGGAPSAQRAAAPAAKAEANGK